MTEIVDIIVPQMVEVKNVEVIPLERISEPTVEQTVHATVVNSQVRVQVYRGVRTLVTAPTEHETDEVSNKSAALSQTKADSS